MRNSQGALKSRDEICMRMEDIAELLQSNSHQKQKQKIFGLVKSLSSQYGIRNRKTVARKIHSILNSLSYSINTGNIEEVEEFLEQLEQLIDERKKGEQKMFLKKEKQDKRILKLEKKREKWRKKRTTHYAALKSNEEKKESLKKEAAALPPNNPDRKRLAQEMARCEKNSMSAQTNISKIEASIDIIVDQMNLIVRDQVAKDIAKDTPTPEKAIDIVAGARVSEGLAEEKLGQANEIFASISGDEDIVSKKLAEIEEYNVKEGTGTINANFEQPANQTKTYSSELDTMLESDDVKEILSNENHEHIHEKALPDRNVAVETLTTENPESQT